MSNKNTSENSEKRAWPIKLVALTKLLPKSKNSIVKATVALIVITVIAGAIPLPYTFAKSVTIPFDTSKHQSAKLELNDSKVIQEGTNGTELVQVKSLQSLWGRIFGVKPLRQEETTSTVSKPPVNRIVVEGTRKYQYMICSDGSHRYFTDKQFKEPQTGFTSKSDDACKESNQGVKLKLADSLDGTVNNPVTSPQSDTYEADKIDREVEKLRWCSEQDEKISSEYIGKVHQAQATQGITDKEFNAIVDPAYFKYSNQVKSLRATGCSITVVYPDYTR